MQTTYKIFNSSAAIQTQIENNYARYIETADDIFGLFIRSCILNRFSKPIVFLIVDKSQKQIDFFKDLLTWNGELDLLLPILCATAKKLGADIESIDTIRNKIEQEVANNFDHLKKSWQIFQNSAFKFVNLDVVEDNKQFLEILNSLPNLSKGNQSVRLNFGHNNSIEYTEAINNVLHFLSMKSIRNYKSMVTLADAENNSIVNFAGELYAQFNPTFCILPWMHIQYKPSGQSKLCCRYDIAKESAESAADSKNNLSNLANEREKLTIQKTSIENSFYSHYWNSARDLTLNNQPISGCYKCYEGEKSSRPGSISTSSMRLGSSILYNEGYLHKRPKYQDPKIEFLEIGFGNYCNLACLSCNSTLSTSWHDDEVVLNKSVDKKLQRVVFPKLDNLKFEPNEDTLKNLTTIKFTGGEPMINPEFVKFIELVCSKGYPENISLEIYTNCSYIPSAKLLTNLGKFKSVQLNLSVDALGHTNDYIRYRSVWQGDQKQTVSGAIDHWLSASKKYKNIHVIIEMPSLIEWWVQKFINDGNVKILHKTDYSYYDGFFKIQPAHDPDYLNVNSLPKELYQDVLDWVRTYRDSFLKKHPVLTTIPASIGFSLDKLENTINSAKGNVNQADGFINYLKAMDSIRKNSCQESIPEIVTRVNKYLESQAQA
jgi:organic radical activating enzyme